MNEKKNIDKLFKEQLKDFEVAPNDAVWEKIHDELHQDKRKKRRVLIIWWRAAGIAAAIAILVAVGTRVFNATDNLNQEPTIVKDSNSDATSDNENSNANSNSKELNKQLIDNKDNNTQIVTTNNSDSEENTTNNITISKEDPLTTSETQNTIVSEHKRFKQEDQKSANKSSVSESNQNENRLKSQSSEDYGLTTKDVVADARQGSNTSNEDSETVIKNKSELKKLIQNEKESSSTSVTDNGTTQNTESNTTSEQDNKTSNLEDTDPQTTSEDENTNAIEDAIAQAEDDTNEKEKEDEKLNRWSVSPNVAPVYFSSLGEGSSIDDQFIGNTKESEINMSYGISGSYAITEKLKIRAGINRVDLGYSTNDVLIFENGNSDGLARVSSQMKHVNVSENVGRYSIYSADSFNFNNAPATLFIQEQGSLDQQLGFIEVPVEIEYNLIEKKIGLNLIGGFSTLFLNQNDIYAVFTDGQRERIGDASNVRDLSYSANFGIGLDYNFSKQWQFNFEPTFKYQINTFENTSGDFQPFFVGVYTGLSFKF